MGQGVSERIMRKIIGSRFGETAFLLFCIFAALNLAALSYLYREASRKEDIIYQTAYDLIYKQDHNAVIKDLMEGQFSAKKVDLGKAKLKINGFVDKYQSFYRKQAQRSGICVSVLLMALYVTVCLLIYRMYLKQKRDEKRRLSEIERTLTSFQSYVYTIDYDFNQEGEMPAIYARLNSLGEKIKLTERQMLKEKEKTKTMVTDISHQLKTPLAALKTFFDLIMDKDLSEAERIEFMSRCQGQLEHLQQLTASLIDISRMEKGMIEIKKDRASLIDTIAAAVSSVYTKAQEKQIDIEMKEMGPEEDVRIPHDRKWTKEAFVNILDNAVKYSYVNTKIQIRIVKRTSYLRIEIEDEGVGIPKKEFHMIYKRFYRGSSSETMQTEGAGVGLYLVREIVEKQQGSITVTSHATEKKTGSTFVVQLPYTG